MFKNYFITALRSFKKNKATTAINVLGLSIGISASLIIFLIAQYHYSFDTWQPDANNIYRIESEGEGWKSSNVPVPMHEAASQKASGIQTTALFLQYNDRNAKVAIPQENAQTPQLFKSQRSIVFADSNYFSLFPQQWVIGNASSSLLYPYQLVLTESRAHQYFPHISLSQVIGKTVVFSDTVVTTITGIVKDLKENSHFKYDAYISLSTISRSSLKTDYGWNDWKSVNSNTQTFVKLVAGADYENINRQLTTIFKEHTNAGNEKIFLRLQPLTDIHISKVRESTIRNLVLLALFLLILASINFINLSTAQAAERAKEIGIRKTLGSKKRQLIFQFLSQTFLLTLFTAFVSVALMPLLLNAFSGFIPAGLQFEYFLSQPVVWGFLLLLVTVVSLVAGIYPAFILTKFKPVSVLKNKGAANTGSGREARLRKSLIVFQFAIAQVFIVGVFVVYKQINFSIEKDMGFRKEAIVNFNMPSGNHNPDNKKLVLRDELKRIPEIQQVSLGNRSPAFNGRMTAKILFDDKGKEQKLEVDSRSGDTTFLSVYGLKLVAGRNIAYGDTAKELLINETLARQLGFTNPADAINRFISIDSSLLPVVGVMQDFHLASVRTVINPMVYYADMKAAFVMHVALQTDPATWSSAIDKMQVAWKAIYPEADFQYAFVDNSISEFYKEDRQLFTLLSWSAGIAILISCLGLLGLVIFMTNNRVKEIGIRKVLGASVGKIITLLSVDFVKLLLIAFVIATPIAWWQTNKWLQSFAYRTTLSWWIFLLSGLFLIVIAIIILSIRAGKAALANPVKSLRTE